MGTFYKRLTKKQLKALRGGIHGYDGAPHGSASASAASQSGAVNLPGEPVGREPVELAGPR